MRFRRIALSLLIAGAAGCGTPSDVPPPELQSSYTGTGEVRIGRYLLVQDRITKKDTNIHHVLYSETWGRRRGPKVENAFSRLAFPASAPTNDHVMTALLDRFAQHGYFSLPRRASVHPDDILVPGRKVDVLFVETESVAAFVFFRDCAGVAQQRTFLKCVKDFADLTNVHRPVQVGVGVEGLNTFLYRKLRQPPREPVEEPEPTTDLKPAPFTPEARKRMEEERSSQRDPDAPPSGTPAPK